ncbi:hypothetical protein H0H92_015867 [Tricholoma furcatifolium]|nr:hypothetical protein H0H92_015867 [Tricholoma furcatifolium]
MPKTRNITREQLDESRHRLAEKALLANMTPFYQTRGTEDLGLFLDAFYAIWWHRFPFNLVEFDSDRDALEFTQNVRNKNTVVESWERQMCLCLCPRPRKILHQDEKDEPAASTLEAGCSKHGDKERGRKGYLSTQGVATLSTTFLTKEKIVTTPVIPGGPSAALANSIGAENNVEIAYDPAYLSHLEECNEDVPKQKPVPSVRETVDITQ